jgi:urate oxidase
MGIVLGQNSYGKSGNHLFKVLRGTERHEVRDYRVDINLSGDYDAAHIEGDNADLMATDTMRNTVYAVAQQHDFDSPEQYGLHLVGYLLTQPRVHVARVHVVEQRWERISVAGSPHPHSFTKAAGGQHMADISGSGDDRQVRSGIVELNVLKTTNSGWEGFMEGGFRTLPDTDDRILATVVTADWDYAWTDVDYGKVWAGVHEQIAITFTDHYSPSVQHTIYQMGQAVLERFPELARMRFELPNRHHILYNLSPFGLENDHAIHVVTVEPYGLIRATVERD